MAVLRVHVRNSMMVSFGGASNQELAEVITDTTALKNAYETVINAYNLKHIDFDIEGDKKYYIPTDLTLEGRARAFKTEDISRLVASNKNNNNYLAPF